MQCERDRAEINDLAADGWYPVAIAERLDLGLQHVIRLIDPVHRRRQAAELRSRGKSFEDVAQITGISTTAQRRDLRDWLKELAAAGLDPRDIAQRTAVPVSLAAAAVRRAVRCRAGCRSCRAVPRWSSGWPPGSRERTGPSRDGRRY